MSTYVKPFKQCQDSAVGFRTVNEIAGSQDAMRELFEIEHTGSPDGPPLVIGTGDFSGRPAQTIGTIEKVGGEHDTPKVAIGTIGITIVTAAAPGAPTVLVRYAIGACTSIVRLGEGSYFIPLPGDVTDFYVEPQPLAADSSTYRLCQQKPSSAFTVGTTPHGVYVSTWEEATLDGGNLGFELAEYSFDVTVYGNRGTDLNDSLPTYVVKGNANVQRGRQWQPRSRVFYVRS